ncbi:MAG: ribbon-helix-helix protein, CopG family [Actinomycetota bacterium]
MVRTQIQLTEDQVKRLKRVAAQRGVSMAAVIREAVDRSIAPDDEDAKWERAMSVVGRFRSDRPDVSERHDDYFADAILDE